MRESERIPAVVMRGGTSKGVYVLANDLPRDPAIPKVAFVAPPQDYGTITGKRVAAAECDLLARTKALAVMHKAYAVTGGICLGAAALIEGTVVNAVVGQRARTTGVVRVGHPSGVSDFLITVSRKPSGEFELTRSGVAGTSRRIMDGTVYVPRRIFYPVSDGSQERFTQKDDCEGTVSSVGTPPPSKTL